MASIIDKKYTERYRKGGGDWTSKFIDERVADPITKERTKKGEDGTETTETVTLKGSRVNLEKLFALAEANHIDVSGYRGDVDKKNAPGRLRMTVGNRLRAVAKRQHGLNDTEGTFHEADAETIGGKPRTQDPATGDKILLKAADESSEAVSEAA